MTKAQVRQKLLQELRQQPELGRLTKSFKIAGTLRRLAVYRRARWILCYAAIDGEVETQRILAEATGDGKRVAVPAVRPGHRLHAVEIRDAHQDLRRRGLFGIPEPHPRFGRQVDPKRLGLVVLPGIAFDRRGQRLGRGKGYFDRFLAKIPQRVPRVALAFGFQVLRRLPTEPHDQPVSAIVTERGVIHCREGKVAR